MVNKPIIVAEATTNHMGNLNVALEMIKQAKLAGADYIKFAVKDVDSYYTADKLAMPFDSPYGHTYGEYRRMFEFNDEQFGVIDRCCQHWHLPWFVTVQDLPSMVRMAKFELPMYKIASSNARNWSFLRSVRKMLPYGSDLVLSVGGSSLIEIRVAVDEINPTNIMLILQHCVAEYPCPPEHTYAKNVMLLNSEFAKKQLVRVGYSGHEEGWQPTLAAVNYGAFTIERHFCLSRHTFVHHIECSLEPDEFAQMVQDIDNSTPPVNYAGIDKAQFGMTDNQVDFLVHQRYGQDFLQKGSTIT